MFKHAVLAAVFVGVVSGTALAWGEVSISLEDPSGHPTEGALQTGRMEGYYCSSRPDAETIADYLSGVKVYAEDLAIAIGHCKPDVRYVAGIFPDEGNYPVVFVRMLADFTKSGYLVRGFLSDMKLQEARAK